ncbi:MAG: STAS domain-containing protein [Acidobacteriota bacterium]|nr:STAS domain-containing protein [Acidobacteriota bacterium]
MQIERDQRGDLIILAINGPIIIGESARQFTEYLDGILEEDCKGVIIDLSHINYVDSTGLGELVGYMQMFNEKGRTMALLNPHDRIMSLFKLTSLDKEFSIFFNLEDAVKALS